MMENFGRRSVFLGHLASEQSWKALGKAVVGSPGRLAVPSLIHSLERASVITRRVIIVTIGELLNV